MSKTENTPYITLNGDRFGTKGLVKLSEAPAVIAGGCTVALAGVFNHVSGATLPNDLLIFGTTFFAMLGHFINRAEDFSIKHRTIAADKSLDKKTRG